MRTESDHGRLTANSLNIKDEVTHSIFIWTKLQGEASKHKYSYESVKGLDGHEGGLRPEGLAGRLTGRRAAAGARRDAADARRDRGPQTNKGVAPTDGPPSTPTRTRVK